MMDLKQKILQAVSGDLAEIEIELKNNLQPYLEIVKEVAGHIMFGGGKRIRPLLMVLCARICGYEGKNEKRISSIFEYLHTATLLHDDLVDGAPLRRGKPAAHTVWGNPIAVLTGDFLLARSLSLASETKKPEVIHVISQITENMSQGEIHQLLRKGNTAITESEYMEIIRRKTAVLIQGACQVGALIADASKEKEQALSAYGYHVGIAFQIADDLLDYTADTQTIGKTVGADLREGKLTLPVIAALSKATKYDSDQMMNIIQDQNFSNEQFKLFVDLLHRYNGISYAQQIALDHVIKAKNSISIFDDSDTKTVLQHIADYALKRKL